MVYEICFFDFKKNFFYFKYLIKSLKKLSGITPIRVAFNWFRILLTMDIFIRKIRISVLLCQG